MFATLLQLVGFISGLVLLMIYYAVGGRSAWPALFTAAFSVHFAGDWLMAFLKAPLIIANYNVSEAVFPKKFTQFLGLMLTLAAVLFLAFGHLRLGGWFAFFGLALALTGFVWDLIYP